ncbi:uncharacterized protein LOC101737288 [Bombyx mori]|uniref:monoamine oxidase n=1 Tax=Bombyx mori TaxID=7091 RepID=A0A8R1WFL7_BOMMO|nr:uncharacterized protein LOC101737288 [Bombyx mori]
MVQKLDETHKKSVKADVIILGCSLSGIVAAHKLKRRFGDSMDIVVLDLAGQTQSYSKYNVVFEDVEKDSQDIITEPDFQGTAKQMIENVARFYLAKYAKEFHVPLPDVIIAPERVRTRLTKLFQHQNGNTVECTNDFHEFDYLSVMERFEINQYQNMLDQSMKDLFQRHKVDLQAERNRLRYYDQTCMESHIRGALLFPTSKEIMRSTVKLVCGAPANSVSVLFYLHQCYRTGSTKNHLDGNNTKFREKTLGHCRKRLQKKLQQSIADITLSAKSIKEIRTYSDEQVILETIKGETDYVCNLLAMALKPDQLDSIRVEDELLAVNLANKIRAMIPGRARRFVIQYEDNFWTKLGYSGDILSIRGPIIWAMEKPEMSTTGSLEKYPSLIGYLMVRDESDGDSKEAVIEQLIKLFGNNASSPVNYKETNIADLFIPRCGDYVALKELTGEGSPKHLEWGTLDIFADGDVAAALEAGHTAYLNLLTSLRPQAQTYEDRSTADWPRFLEDSPVQRWYSHVNFANGIHLLVYSAAAYYGLRVVRSYFRK